MSIMLAEIYDALKEAKVSDATARKAAEAVAAYESRFGGIETKLAEMSGTLRFLQWQIGLGFALVVAIAGPSLWLLLRVAAKLGAIT